MAGTRDGKIGKKSPLFFLEFTPGNALDFSRKTNEAPGNETKCASRVGAGSGVFQHDPRAFLSKEAGRPQNTFCITELLAMRGDYIERQLPRRCPVLLGIDGCLL